jgi:hypothetical protein
LDQMWQRLEIDRILTGLLKERKYENPIERLLFAMVANRALAPSIKLHMEHWVENETCI